MDTLTIDLSGHPEAVPGDVVTLWGPGGPDIESVAGCAGTISAHLCVGLTARVPRILRGLTLSGLTPGATRKNAREANRSTAPVPASLTEMPMEANSPPTASGPSI